MGKQWINGAVISLLIVVVVVGGWQPPQLAHAQDPLTQSFTTSDGRLSVNYPETWAATDYLGVMLSNDPTLLETFEFDVLPDGTFVLVIVAGSINELLSFTGNSTFEKEVLEFAQQEAEDSFTEYVGPKVEDFGGRTAYRTIGTFQGLEAVFMYIDLGEGNILEVALFANEGVIQEYGKTIEAVVMSAQYEAAAAPPEPEEVQPEDVEPQDVEPQEAGRVIWQQTAQFDYEDLTPIGSVVVGPDDTIYIAGYYSGISSFDADGNLLAVIGDENSTSGWSGFVEDMALAPDGTLWVVDGSQNLIHIETDGDILHQWGELGEDSGEFGQYSPGEVEVTPDGRVVTLDRQDDDEYYTVARIQVWDAEGTLLDEYVPDPPGTETYITGYADLEMGPDGTLYIAALYELWRMDLETGAITEVVLDPILPDYTFFDAFAVSANGDLVLANSDGGIFWFDNRGRYLGQYGQAQSSDYAGSEAPRFMDGEFYGPLGVGVLSNGQVVVSDYNYTWWQIVLFTFGE